MKLGILTDALAKRSLREVVDFAAGLHLDGIELTTGNWSQAPHVQLDELLSDTRARTNLLHLLNEGGLELLALNANGNPLHPDEGAAHDDVVRKTMRLASDLGVRTVVVMSGLPAGVPGDSTPNWITSSWPPEAVAMHEYQWNTVAIPYWESLAEEAGRLGVQLAVEMHGRQLVYNVSSYQQLKKAVDSPAIGANLDPSHLMWQGCDIPSVIQELGKEIIHVHAKDVRIERRRSDVNGVLDPLPPSAASQRAWNYVTLGNGHAGGAEFWRDFVYTLRTVGYEGPLSIEHEDVLVSGEEGVKRSVEILSSTLFQQAPDWVPADV